MLFSTQGTKEARKDFEIRLVNWVNHFPGFKTDKMSNLVVQFYLKDLLEFSNVMNSKSTNLFKSTFYQEKQEPLFAMLRNINSIELLGITETQSESLSWIFNDFVSAQYHEEEYCEFSGTRREDLENLALKLLDVKLEAEFLQLGNLKEAKVRSQ